MYDPILIYVEWWFPSESVVRQASTSFGRIIIGRSPAHCLQGRCAPPTLENKDELYATIAALMSGLNI